MKFHNSKKANVAELLPGYDAILVSLSRKLGIEDSDRPSVPWGLDFL